MPTGMINGPRQEHVSRYITGLVHNEPGGLGFRYIKQTMFAFVWPRGVRAGWC